MDDYTEPPLDVREDFPILAHKINGHRLVYLDSAATSQKPRHVLDAERDFYEHNNANVHRGVHSLSERATADYEGARQRVAGFINAISEEIVFVRNATEGINLVASSWAASNLKKGDIIVLTVMEHHSNIVAWQRVAADVGAKIEYVPLSENNGTLDPIQYAKLLQKKPKLVAFTHMSNVLGTVNPAKQMIADAHAAGAIVLLDACQSIPHMPIDVQDLDCDFLVFSGHKMLAPTGIGVLFGRRELFESMPPFLVGGDMIKEVTLKKSTWNDVPHKFEAGTPNVAGAVGLAAAIEYLERIGMDVILAHDKEIALDAFVKLTKVPGITLFGPPDPNARLGVITFTIKDIPAHDVASLLDDQGIAVRSGHHCAMPLHTVLGVDSTVRASFSIINTKEDADALVKGLLHCREVFKL